MSIRNQPTNINFLSPVGFDFRIKKLPTVNFFVQNVVLPGIQFDSAELPTPFKVLHFPGSGSINYSDFEISFKVDEDMKNYMEIFNWITKMGNPETFTYGQLDGVDTTTGDGVFSDSTLIILNSAMSPNIIVNIYDMFPVGLSPLDFNMKLSDIQYVEASAQFRFKNYSFSTT